MHQREVDYRPDPIFYPGRHTRNAGKADAKHRIVYLVKLEEAGGP